MNKKTKRQNPHIMTQVYNWKKNSHSNSWEKTHKNSAFEENCAKLIIKWTHTFSKSRESNYLQNCNYCVAAVPQDYCVSW